MKTITQDFASAAIISFIIVLPFAILEALNNGVTRENAFCLILLLVCCGFYPLHSSLFSDR